MADHLPSPRIETLSWGRVEIDDGRAFKDAKLFPGGAREWDWRETGTHHDPGIQPADIAELIERGATTVVLSMGVWERLRIRPETLQLLKARNISAHVLQTEEAVRLYNELCGRDAAVGALIHSTC